METNLFFSRDSEAAFGTQSATMGGSFWIRIRLGKAVAGPGVPTTSTTTMGLLGFGPPRVVCFCSSAATSALRSINARSTKQGSIGDDDFVWSSGTERAMFLCCNIPCLTRTSLAVGCAVLDSPHCGQVCSCWRPATAPSKTRNLWPRFPRWWTRPVWTPLRHGHLQRGQT